MKTWIKKTFSESSGVPSWLRQIGTLIVVDILAVWTFACIVNKQFVAMDWTSLSVLIGVLGAKAYSKKQEGA